VEAGYGRVRDATGVYAARGIEHRLLASGAITRPLSREGLTRLVSLLYIDGFFSVVHDRFPKYFWDDLTEVLRDDGALRDSVLGAGDAFRALEPTRPEPLSPPFLDVVPAYRFQRLRGAFVGMAVSGLHIQTIDRFDETLSSLAETEGTPPSTSLFLSSARAEENGDILFVGPSAEFHRPVGLRWQLGAVGRVQFPVERSRKGMVETSELRADYLVAERWLATAGIIHERQIDRDPPSPSALAPDWFDAWRVRGVAGVSYYIEDRLAIGLNATEQQSHVRTSSHGVPVNTGSWIRFGEINLSLSYRFAAGLRAPGIITPLSLGQPWR
jgi:hypothetical protein